MPGEQLIDRGNSWADLLQLSPVVHFRMANATVSLQSMLASYPGPLSLVTVQVREGFCLLSAPFDSTEDAYSVDLLARPLSSLACLTGGILCPACAAVPGPALQGPPQETARGAAPACVRHCRAHAAWRPRVPAVRCSRGSRVHA